MDIIDVVFIAVGLLMFGALAQTQLPQDWQTSGGLLLVSFVGIPGSILLLGLVVNAPWLLVILLIAAGLYSGIK